MSERIIAHKFLDRKTNTVRTKSYSKGDLLGKGGFAKCYRIKSLESNETYACKIVPKAKLKKKSTRIKLITEIKIHKLLSCHKNIVRFIKWFEDENSVYIILELCPNKSLLGLLNSRKKFSESEVRFFMTQILSAVRHLHSRNVIHRDLKLGNIFITENFELKLGDFGLATMLRWKSQRKMTLCGTPNYIAPEIIDRKTDGHSFEVDIWSLGVIMYTMLFGVPPFESPSVKSTYVKIKSNHYSFPDPSFISKPAENLIRRILQLDPNKRPSLKQIRMDPFFTESMVPKSLPKTFLSEVPFISEFKEKLSDSIFSFGEEFHSNTSERKIKAGGFEKEHDRFNSLYKDSPDILEPMEIVSNKGVQSSEGDLSIKKEKALKLFKEKVPSDYRPAVWVALWIDYSSKYGMAYMLSDGSSGVYFNDCSKMVVPADKKKIDYFEPIEEENGSKQSLKAAEKRRPIDPFCAEVKLKKKVTLLKYFSEFLERKMQSDEGLLNAIKRRKKTLPSKTLEFQEPLRVFLWYKTSKAIIFVLSNNVIQVNFFDETKVIFSPLCLINKCDSINKSEKCPHDEFGCEKLRNEIGFYERNFAVTLMSHSGGVESCLFSAALAERKNSAEKHFSYAYDVLKKAVVFFPSFCE